VRYHLAHLDLVDADRIGIWRLNLFGRRFCRVLGLERDRR
jgi:hypothetical protein